MIQEQVQFYGSFGASKMSPVKERESQIDDCRVQAHQLVLEAELASPSSAGHHGLASRQQLFEDSLIQLPGPMLVSISQCRSFRRLTQSQVSALTFAAGQAATNFA